MITVRALGSRVLVRRWRQPSVLPSGLVLPSEYVGFEPGRGVVVSIGPDVPGFLGLSLGELVAFEPEAGADVLLDGRAHVFLDVADVLALLPWPEDGWSPGEAVGAEVSPSGEVTLIE